LSQPDANPYALANLVAPALDGIVNALSDRGSQSEAQYQAKADQFRILILSFQPSDVIDLQLSGQTVLFNEVLANSAHDVLRGMDDAAKPRAIASLISIGRLAQGHLDRLVKRGNKPHRTETVSVEQEKIRTSLALAPAAEPHEMPRPLAAMPPWVEPAAPDPEVDAPETRDTPLERLVEETSWLDEPFVQWLIETPADLVRKSGLLVTSETPAPAQAADRDDGTWPDQAEAPPEPALPCQPDGYAPARTMPAGAMSAGTMSARLSPTPTMMDADASAGD
jgi:hypothetical protein